MSDERVAALEAHREGDKASLERMSGKLDTVAADVAEIKLRLAGQSGFLAGVLAIILPVWTFITIAIGYAWDWWQSGHQQ